MIFIGNTSEKTRWALIILVCSLGSFMGSFDVSTSTLAIPLFLEIFHSDLQTVTLIITLYSVVIISSIIVLGKIADLWSLKYSCLTGYAVFTVGSLLCAVSGSLPALIVFRLIQALGDAMLIISSIALIHLLIPDSFQARAFTWHGILSALGGILGFGFGGVILAFFGWDMIFLINIPFGICGFLLGKKYLKEPQRRHSAGTLDYAGAAFLVLFVSLLLIGLIIVELPGIGDLVLGLIFLVVIFAGLILFERLRKCKNPIIDLTLFKNRNFSASVFASTLLICISIIVMFVYPMYLLMVLDMEYHWTGGLIMLTSIISLVISPYFGKFADLYGSRRICLLGAGLAVIILVLLGFSEIITTFWALVCLICILRCATQLSYGPYFKIIMDNSPEDQSGSVSGIISTIRHSVRVFGVVIAQMVFLVVIHTGRTTGLQDSFLSVSDPVLVTFAYQIIFFICAVFAVIALILTFFISKDQ